MNLDLLDPESSRLVKALWKWSRKKHELDMSRKGLPAGLPGEPKEKAEAFERASDELAEVLEAAFEEARAT